MGRTSKFTAAFKAKILMPQALAAIEAQKEKETLAELAKRFDVSPAKISEWRDEFVKNASHAFENPESSSREMRRVKAENDRLLHKVGQLTLENDFFAKACEDAGLKVR